MATPIHVRDSVRQVDSTSWLIGRSHILRLIQGPYDGDCLWKNTTTANSCYALSPAPSPPPRTTPLPPDDPHVRQTHDAGDAPAVFSFGNEIIIKVRIACDGTRREPETLVFLARHRHRLSFDIPAVLFYAEEDGKTFLCEPHVRGRRLNEAWWDMGEEGRENVVARVAAVCEEVRGFCAAEMTGVDHNWLDPPQEERAEGVVGLKRHCKRLGMEVDGGVFVLAHNDLGPTNVFVDGERVVVVDWEMAGYMPLEWVRTKFAVCGVFGVERGKGAGLEVDQEDRARVEKRLGEMGFPEVRDAYREMNRP